MAWWVFYFGFGFGFGLIGPVFCAAVLPLLKTRASPFR
jgi:hypothetical protein